jgi:hypothetical protein
MDRQLVVLLPRQSPPVADDSLQPASDFEFVVSTGTKAVDQTSRRAIRSRVMRNYVQEKKGDKTNTASKQSSSTVRAGTKSLKGRWRLNSREHQRDPNSSKREARITKAHAQALTLPDANEASPGVISLEDQGVSPEHEPTLAIHDLGDDEPNGNFLIEDLVKVQSLPRYFDHQIDPFDALPIPGGPRTERILYICMFSSLHCALCFCYKLSARPIRIDDGPRSGRWHALSPAFDANMPLARPSESI